LSGVNGELTLRGTSQALELRALRFGCHTHPQRQREVCGGDFEGELKRGDFGASFGMPFVENRVRLVIQVEGIRQ
jgi:polyisoprenoid-binding protein YceI